MNEIEIKTKQLENRDVPCYSTRGWSGYRHKEIIQIWHKGQHVASIEHSEGAYAAPYDGQWNTYRTKKPFIKTRVNISALQQDDRLKVYGCEQHPKIKIFVEDSRVFAIGLYQYSSHSGPTIWHKHKVKEGWQVCVDYTTKEILKEEINEKFSERELRFFNDICDSVCSPPLCDYKVTGQGLLHKIKEIAKYNDLRRWGLDNKIMDKIKAFPPSERALLEEIVRFG